MAARARGALEAVAPEGRCDLTVDVTDDLPVANLAELLGMPASDRQLMLRWTNRVIGYQDPEHGEGARDERGRLVNPRSPAALPTCSPTPTTSPRTSAAIRPTT